MGNVSYFYLNSSLPTTTVEEILIINTFQNAQAKQIDTMYTTEEEFQKISNKSII